MSDKHRNLLETRIQKEASERAASHMENRNDSQHETGYARGYWVALKDVLEWSQEIATEGNNA